MAELEGSYPLLLSEEFSVASIEVPLPFDEPLAFDASLLPRLINRFFHVLGCVGGNSADVLVEVVVAVTVAMFQRCINVTGDYLMLGTLR